jgi:DNA-binding beta-propeller fold protein YncE
MRRPIFIALTAALAAVGPVASAQAAPYDLVFQSCIMRVSTGAGCGVVDSELRANDVAVSPDGANVYVVGWDGTPGLTEATDGRLTVYARAADGSLRRAGCFGDTVVDGCSGTAIPALKGANAVALSPDGRSLYVASRGDGTAAHRGAVLAFARGADDELTFRSCIGTGTADGCAGGKAAIGLGAPDDLAVSPAGDRVAVGGRRSFLVDYRRDADGSLAFNGCIGATSPDCATSSHLGDVTALAFNADGRDLYAATRAGVGSGWDTVVHLVRDDGGLAETDCIGRTPSGCSRTSSHVVDPTGVTVTPEDSEVFLVGRNPTFVTRFLRGPSGALSDFGCAVGLGPTGCEIAGLDISGSEGVVASPDGTGVYVATASGALLTYARRRDAGLSLIRCQEPLPCSLGSFRGAAQLAFSPDGANLYIADNTIGYHFVQIYGRPPIQGTTVPPGGLPIAPPLKNG